MNLVPVETKQFSYSRTDHRSVTLVVMGNGKAGERRGYHQVLIQVREDDPLWMKIQNEAEDFALMARVYVLRGYDPERLSWVLSGVSKTIPLPLKWGGHSYYRVVDVSLRSIINGIRAKAGLVGRS